ncbi:unnamed protein product, partial [Protopolystoma xenopodis]
MIMCDRLGRHLESLVPQMVDKPLSESLSYGAFGAGKTGSGSAFGVNDGGSSTVSSSSRHWPICPFAVCLTTTQIAVVTLLILLLLMLISALLLVVYRRHRLSLSAVSSSHPSGSGMGIGLGCGGGNAAEEDEGEVEEEEEEDDDEEEEEGEEGEEVEEEEYPLSAASRYLTGYKSRAEDRPPGLTDHSGSAAQAVAHLNSHFPVLLPSGGEIYNSEPHPATAPAMRALKSGVGRFIQPWAYLSLTQPKSRPARPASGQHSGLAWLDPGGIQTTRSAFLAPLGSGVLEGEYTSSTSVSHPPPPPPPPPPS